MRKSLLRQRRGVTLVELTAVMAITAIISLMIVSFSTLISAQVKKNDTRADFLQDASSFRVAVQQYFSAIDESEKEFIVTVEENTLAFDDDNHFDFSSYKTVDGVAVEANAQLLKITLTNDTLNTKQSFIIFSHCGASFAEGGGV